MWGLSRSISSSAHRILRRASSVMGAFYTFRLITIVVPSPGALSRM
jgi:hypothetical protein